MDAIEVTLVALQIASGLLFACGAMGLLAEAFEAALDALEGIDG